MPEITATRSAALQLADERKLMRQGYEFLDEKRVLLAGEILRRLRDYEERFGRLVDRTKDAASALGDAVERHGLDQLQGYPVPDAPAVPRAEQTLFLGLPMRSASYGAVTASAEPYAVDASPEAKACRAAFEALLWTAADAGQRASNLMRLAREYRRTERRANALEKVLLPEVEEAIKLIDEQLETMEREEIIRTRWSKSKTEIGMEPRR